MDNWRRGGIDPATAGDDFLRNLRSLQIMSNARQVQAYIDSGQHGPSFLEPDFIVPMNRTRTSLRECLRRLLTYRRKPPHA